ncbi:11367_t:CDS:2 [Dentiscutata erythropus]|uniref:11367_t:CDS:1 n=1 Tax=Dentiscutata erythropus TaxID=1348616 RepID=A0A9N9NJI9_9GLOM|nr:11367_t:CDS:2 [Dentiscutata erythropus]
MWFGVKLQRVILELTKYYMKCGMFSNERFKNILEAILTTKVKTKNANRLALLRYWKFAAINQKEINGFKVQDAIASKMTQVAAEMAWKEQLENAKKVRQAITINRITSPANKSNVESSSANNSNIESSSANNSNIESSYTDKSLRPVNIELNSKLDGPKIVYKNSELPNYDSYNIDDN